MRVALRTFRVQRIMPIDRTPTYSAVDTKEANGLTHPATYSAVYPLVAIQRLSHGGNPRYTCISP